MTPELLLCLLLAVSLLVTRPRPPPPHSSQVSAMVASTERVRAWFELAQSCMSEDSWKVATEIPDASLSHRSSPLGGHLVKFLPCT